MITSLTSRAAERSRLRAQAGWLDAAAGTPARRLARDAKFLLIVALAAMREHLKAVGRELAAVKVHRSS